MAAVMAEKEGDLGVCFIKLYRISIQTLLVNRSYLGLNKKLIKEFFIQIMRLACLALCLFTFWYKCPFHYSCSQIFSGSCIGNV